MNHQVTSANKIGLIAFGLLLAIGGSELILQLAHFGVQPWLNSKVKLLKTTPNSLPQRYILCAGDSHTFGMGAAPEQSYPAQLQTILDNQCGANYYTVVNLGKPGAGSSEIVQQLLAGMKDYPPTIVILMMGANNLFWQINPEVNPTGDNHRLAQALPAWIGKAWLWTRNHSRLLKLISIIVTRAGEPLEPPSLTPSENATPTVQVTPPSTWYTQAIVNAWNHTEAGKPEAAIAELSELLPVYGADPTLMFQLFLIIRQQVHKAILADDEAARQYWSEQFLKWIRYLAQFEVKAESRTENILLQACNFYFANYTGPPIQEIEALLINCGGFTEAIENIKTQYHQVAQGTNEVPLLTMYRQVAAPATTFTRERLQRDYLQVIRTTAAQRVTLILMDYPASQKFSYGNLIPTIAEEYELPMVSIQQVFNELPDPRQAIGSDRIHPNAKGYELIAQELTTLILSLKLSCSKSR